MSVEERQAVRCGIILAAGEGKRLKSFVKKWSGSDLPKQYVKFTEEGSSLERTFQRVEKVISREKLFTVVDQQHLQYPEAFDQLKCRPEGRLVCQPQNKETAPGLLLPLIHLLKRYPHADVAVFPSDHHIEEDDLFSSYLEQAFSVVADDPSRIVLLGIEPNRPEVEYGYILPGSPIDQGQTATVEGFAEKPKKQMAERHILNGGLWNSMVMVFQSQTLLKWILKEMPALFGSFLTIYTAIGTPEETEITERVYQDLEPLNFSSHFLHELALKRPSPLSVLPMRNLSWTDIGSESQILSVLKREERFQTC